VNIAPGKIPIRGKTPKNVYLVYLFTIWDECRLLAGNSEIGKMLFSVPVDGK